MLASPKCFGAARALLAVMALIAAPHATAEAAWAIQKFQVFAGAPYFRAGGTIDVVGVDWAEAEDWFPGFDPAEVEQAFNAAAAWYSRKGFPEPLIEPKVETENGRACRIYVCSEGLMVSTAWGAYMGACARSRGARPIFYLNADGPAFRNKKLTAEGYQTVAHELFHALQGKRSWGTPPNPATREGGSGRARPTL